MDKSAGLTLPEMLITLLVVAALFKLGSANMAHMVAQQCSSASLNQLIGAVAFARNSAISLGIATTFCPSVAANKPTGRSYSCGPRDTWHLGSMVFQDNNRNGQLDDGENLLRRLPGWTHGGTVAWRAFRARSYLQFTRRGFTNWQNGSFVYCPEDQNLRYARRLVLNQAGRSYRAYDRNGDGIDEGSRGRRLRC